MFGDSPVKRHQSFSSHKIVLSSNRCSSLYQWPHARSYNAGSDQPSQADDTLRRRLGKSIYISPSTRDYIEYYNIIRNRNAPGAQTSAAPNLRSVEQSNKAWNSICLSTICPPMVINCSKCHLRPILECFVNQFMRFYVMLPVDKNHHHPWIIE